jgi:hypothetical protein
MNSIPLNDQIFGALTDLHDYDLAEERVTLRPLFDKANKA